MKPHQAFEVEQLIIHPYRLHYDAQDKSAVRFRQDGKILQAPFAPMQMMWASNHPRMEIDAEDSPSTSTSKPRPWSCSWGRR